MPRNASEPVSKPVQPLAFNCTANAHFVQGTCVSVCISKGKRLAALASGDQLFFPGLLRWLVVAGLAVLGL